MEANRFRAARVLFEELVDEPPAIVGARLAQLRAEQPELALAVEELLATDQEAEGFLEAPVGEHAAALVANWLEVSAQRQANAVGEVVGSYRLVAVLGVGGMGEVYLGERADGQFEQQVAVKLLKQGLGSASAEARFANERRILARLQHPNIAHLLDAGLTEAGRPFFVMERVEGQPLTAYCRERRSPTAERLRLILACCAAVEEAHRNLVVHRDLKPSNILVTASGEVKLLDFGIAKLLEPEAPAAGETYLDGRALTPAYAAPEQILGEPISTATDVYALGVLLYELLTDTLPVERATTATTALLSELAQKDRPLERLSVRLRRRGGTAQAARALAGDLDNVVAKALERDPARRYPSAGALAEDLRRHLAGEPVSARRPSLRYRAGKFILRHRLGVAAASLAALSLLVGLGTALSQARVARARAVQAEQQERRAERVKDFLVQLLREANPMRRERAAPLTTAELLDLGVAKAESELADETAVQAQVLTDFAEVWNGLNQDEKALAVAGRAAALWRELEGNLSLGLATNLETQASAFNQSGDYAAAEKAAREAVAIYAARLGPGSLEAAEAKTNLIVLFHHSGRIEEGLAMIDEVLPVFEARLGPEHSSTLLQLQNLGAFQYELGRHAEAEATTRRVVALTEKLFGSDHFRVGVALLNLCGALSANQKLAEAEQVILRSARILEQRAGAVHQLHLTALESLAEVYESQGRRAEARAVLERAVGIREADRGPGDSYLASLRRSLAELEQP
jgi:eukaryotic-like serine/threonine-protein kinase